MVYRENAPLLRNAEAVGFSISYLRYLEYASILPKLDRQLLLLNSKLKTF